MRTRVRRASGGLWTDCPSQFNHSLTRIVFRVALLLSLLVPELAIAADFAGKVVSVLDGDMIEVFHNSIPERVRLNGIDCPEKSQPFGKAARKFTSSLVFGNQVTVQVIGRDQYGRTIGEVTLGDGRSLNRELIRAGFAWWYRKYSKDFSLGDLEDEARMAKRGLWADPNPIPPWEWRKRHR